MITEFVQFDIDPDHSRLFEADFGKAVHHLASAEGCEGVALHRDAERAGSYLMAVRWRSLADHLEGFAESPAAAAFMAAAGSHIVGTPLAAHYESAPVLET